MKKKKSECENSVLWPRCCICKHYHQFINAYERHKEVVGETFDFCLFDKKEPVLLDIDVTKKNLCLNFRLNTIVYEPEKWK